MDAYMDVYIVKFTNDPNHPNEYYIDSLYEDLEEAQKRVKELETGPWAPYDCWISEDYVYLKRKED